ncbi:MAG: thioredoxin family protein [Verrucomicrobia bacterium]|nr:thioredoxin family protein [Verrucomicrobiota bacterium]
MKSFVLAAFAFLAAVVLQAAAAESTWTTDFPAAQALAKKENKLVVMNFTGSDWCSWCKKLQKEVFGTKEFGAYAKEKLVLVEVDFPNGKKQTEALKKANDALQEKFKAEGFPTIVVLNGDGKVVWRQVGYMPGGPEAWISKLKSLK